MKNKIGSALVVGAGISGIRSALDLAELGYRVILIDKAPNLGGTLRQLDHQFPNDHCGMCKMLPLVERDASSQYCMRKGLFHDNIEIRLATELVALEGEPGHFSATLRHSPTLIDPERCMGCGACSEACPVEVPDAFNAGLSLRKAVYLPVPHAIPNSYTVDSAACTRCGACEKVCPTGAIDLKLDARRAFRVLVVDDELVVRDSIKEWLHEEGFEVDMAESGVEALEKLAQHAYKLLLLDVKMPGMDGVEVLKRAKEMRPELPVIMMTAYATVETAVEAMKVGARDYLMKPFDPDTLVSMVVQLYQASEPLGELQVEVGAIVLATGFDSFDPRRGNNTYGYGEIPNVVTSVEFERILSGTGPSRGKLLRPSDAREVRKVAWLQCVGSRNLHVNADFCSSICCMFSIKEARLAKEKTGGAVETALFYMDLRTFGKDFQRYRDEAEQAYNIRFIRSRVHSIEPEGVDGALRVTYSDRSGAMREELFDLVVLAAGQTPPAATAELAETAGIELNAWGFCQLQDYSLSRTSREGISVGGALSGLRDISESIIQAGSAALSASALIHAKGGGLGEAVQAEPTFRDVSRELPQVAVALCTCGDPRLDLEAVRTHLERLGTLSEFIPIERICTREGWESLEKRLESSRANRILIGACLPYLYTKKVRELGKSLGLAPSLIDVVDIRTGAFAGESIERSGIERNVCTALAMGMAKLAGADPVLPASTELTRTALVVGGGIAGLTAALSIADHGFEVHLVEKAGELGGNLRSLYRTLESRSPREILEQTIAKVEKHPKIHLSKKSRVIQSQGRVGHFLTTIETEDGAGKVIEHGVTILATGGGEAQTTSYGYGRSEAIVTQHELEERIQAGSLKPADLGVVAMIQCVDSREGDRNYCSRICCASALKNALYLKERNPEMDVYIFYRDLMAYGFLETHYTRARQAGILFIQYDPGEKPQADFPNGRPRLVALDPILGRPLEIRPDLLVLSTGIVPGDQDRLARIFGVEVNADGFFQEAESKWRPVDFLKEGVYMAGIAHSPRLIGESIAMAEAAAQRALAMLSRERIAGSRQVAEVRHSLCSLCERCIAACPYGARGLDEEEERIFVDALMCQGCGSCAAVCPNSASVLRGYRDQQVFAVVDAALEELF